MKILNDKKNKALNRIKIGKMSTILTKYAQLLVHYCLELREGDKLFISSTMLAEPLVRELYREALAAGAATVEYDLAFRERERLFFQHGKEIALKTPPWLASHAMEHFDCYLNIRAPYNLREGNGATPEQTAMRNAATSHMQQLYFERTADRRLRRNLCQFPTDASAQEAGMGLSEYEQFVFGACKLFHDDPAAAWRQVRAEQQHIVDYLDRCTRFRYIAEGTDLSFSTQGRRWINSDGQTNMPSGEVYTSPVENSAQGRVHFSFPCIHQGNVVEGVTLWVKDGLIEKWEAQTGQEYLDNIFQIPGARRFGEAAVGTNYDIQRITKNILFDEKIGGSVHLAIGQSYLQAGGKNESPIHWDMITDMTQGGQIWADGALVYENGRFIL